jgi:hypothetical protein
MKTVRIVSTTLFYLARILAVFYLAIFIHAFIASFARTSSLHIVKNGTRFEIFYPFTHTPFLLGSYTIGFINTMLMTFSLYALFFYLLSNVFSTFSQSKLFTQRGLRHLRLFYLSNFTFPFLALLIASIISEVATFTVALVVLHLLLGGLCLFYSSHFSTRIKTPESTGFIYINHTLINKN